MDPCNCNTLDSHTADGANSYDAGGYLEYIYRVAASELFGVKVHEGPLPFKAIRNTDFKEVTLEVQPAQNEENLKLHNQMSIHDCAHLHYRKPNNSLVL